MLDTIAAISSGLINQPISIIRLSGSKSFDIMKKIFNGKIGGHHQITYGYIKDNQKNIDEVLVAWFKGPNTYTGEDMVEINAHGGVLNSQLILELLLTNGARLAEPGEFSRTAFLNGKMNLIKAEAIHDLIFAKSKLQHNISINKFDSTTTNLIEQLKSKILKIIATCETNIDYPEYEDIEQLTTENLLPKLDDVSNDLNDIIIASESGRLIQEGIKMVIVGEPNSGKSQLLNSLLREDKAIVTDIAGTTRDIVEGEIQIGTLLFKVMDTAGIHDTDNKIEKIGINKAKQSIEVADLVIHLIDSTKSISKTDEDIASMSLNKPYIKVFNKSDLKEVKNEINISAKLNRIDPLIENIKKIFSYINPNNEKMITNTRQLSLIKLSKNSINEAIEGLKNKMTPDVVIIDIQKSWDHLADILGRTENADILDEMFKNFCLGK